ncbi:MAG: histidinol phosphatase [Flavobacterium sp.]|nr:histidinol phosphatase [Flavobacterium sp.]
MLSLFNKKRFLRDLVPPGYTDIHSHLLPGIDDGAKSFDDTFKLIVGLQDMGFSQFVTTPHIIQHVWENTRPSIEEVHADTQVKLKANSFGLPFRAAAEYMMDGDFLNHLAEGNMLTLGANYILVEMSYLNPPIQLYDVIFEIQLAGYIPVLAHPERYSYYHRNFEEFGKLRNAGCKFQLNLLSTVGYYGKGVTECAARLLKSGFIDFTGSDVHHKAHLAAFRTRLHISGGVDQLTTAMKNNKIFAV